MASRYLVITIDALIGFLVLPFNIAYLGRDAWGLWMLATAVSSYFTVIDLGYGGSVTKFVATYRARRDPQSINEITSTLFTLFTVLGIAAYGLFVLVAFNVEHVFNLSVAQAGTAQALLLITGTQVALGLSFGVFGGVVNAFQRYDINNAVSIGASIAVAAVNVTMLYLGYGLVAVVFATTLVRLGSLLIYRRNAYRVFPLLSVRPSFFRIARLREVSGFSVYVAVIDWSNRLNYASDIIIIGAFLSPAAVALWAVPRRLAAISKSLTNQFNAVLLPVVVDSDTRQKINRLRTIFIHGTRLSLFLVTMISTSLFLLADAVVYGWVGAEFAPSIIITQILAVVVIFRVATAPSSVVLKGAGRHQLLAAATSGTAAVNIGLSLWWIHTYGLPGQALATLIPVGAVSMFILFPAAARLVDVPVATALRRAVWPAVWPLPVMVGVVMALRAVLPMSLYMAAMVGAAGSLAYAAVFVTFAMGRDERAVYSEKIRAAARWRQPPTVPQTPTTQEVA